MGIVEILISMMLLAVLAVAVLPVLVQGLRNSSSNATLATASQFAGQELDSVRALSADCATVSAFDDGPSRVTADARGTPLEIRRTVGACPAAADYPGVVSVSVEVIKVGAPTPVLARATTLVLLKKAAP
jgi:type II secretory pathway pseudopilin PulG